MILTIFWKDSATINDELRKKTIFLLTKEKRKNNNPKHNKIFFKTAKMDDRHFQTEMTLYLYFESCNLIQKRLL